jgi:UDP-GlcNAc:undecaprenyl-phosphate/decaprenyl-phosphate GlcNAc-1-phosphate transferase
MLKVLFYCSFFAFIMSMYANHLLVPVAKHLGLIDTPGGRKQHAENTPLVGGIAMFLAFSFTLLTLPISLSNYRSLIAGLSLLVIIGVLDDLHEVHHYSRLIGQTIASLLMVFWGQNYLTSLGNLLGVGNIGLGVLAIPFTIFITLATINAMNMLDGLDGLLGSISFIISTSLLIIASHMNHRELIFLCAMSLSTILGFLVFNFPIFPRRKITLFMGDSGSMFLGYLLIWLIVDMTRQSSIDALRLVDILWILAVPIFDIINVTLYRVLQKTNPFHASCHHLHHLLQRYHLSRYQSLWCVIVITLLTNGIGLISYCYQLSQPILFYLFATVFTFATLVYQYGWRHRVAR